MSLLVTRKKYLICCNMIIRYKELVPYKNAGLNMKDYSVIALPGRYTNVCIPNCYVLFCILFCNLGFQYVEEVECLEAYGSQLKIQLTQYCFCPYLRSIGISIFRILRN